MFSWRRRRRITSCHTLITARILAATAMTTWTRLFTKAPADMTSSHMFLRSDRSRVRPTTMMMMMMMRRLFLNVFKLLYKM